MALELKRKVGQEIIISNDNIKPIKIKVISVIDGEALLSFEAANDVIINRSEFDARKKLKIGRSTIESQYKEKTGKELREAIEEKSRLGYTMHRTAQSLNLSFNSVKDYAKKYEIKFKKYTQKELAKKYLTVWR